MSLLLGQAEAAEETKSLLDYIREGGSIGLVIIILSVVAVTLIIVHLVRLQLAKLAPPEDVAALEALLSKRDTEGALAYCSDEEHDSFLTRMVGGALTRCRRSPFGTLELRAALEESGQEQVARLHRSIDGVEFIAKIAPMLGLLGTVVGMILGFETISRAQGFARPDQLAGYISLALVTTVMGLVVAMPTIAAVMLLRNRIERLAGQVGEIVEALSAHLHGTGAPGAAPRPASKQPAPAAPARAGAPAATRAARP